MNKPWFASFLLTCLLGVLVAGCAVDDDLSESSPDEEAAPDAPIGEKQQALTYGGFTAYAPTRVGRLLSDVGDILVMFTFSPTGDPQRAPSSGQLIFTMTGRPSPATSINAQITGNCSLLQKRVVVFDAVHDARIDPSRYISTQGLGIRCPNGWTLTSAKVSYSYYPLR